MEAEPCSDRASVFRQYFLDFYGGCVPLFNSYSHDLETIHDRIPPDVHNLSDACHTFIISELADQCLCTVFDRNEQNLSKSGYTNFASELAGQERKNDASNEVYIDRKRLDSDGVFVIMSLVLRQRQCEACACSSAG